MKTLLSILHRSLLFRGIAEEEIEAMLQCLRAWVSDYDKGAYLLRPGESVSAVGLIVQGNVQIVKEDFWGNRNIVARLGPGQLFAESYACTPHVPLDVGALAETPCQVLFLDVQRVLTTCSTACVFHTRLIHNLLSALAEKNVQLNAKLTHLAQRTTREKLLSYLSEESLRQGGPVFTIPFNRQQLADYLSVDRSAMSSALSKMREEGILDFSKNQFTLYERRK